MAQLRLATPSDVPLLVQHRRRMWEDMGGFDPEQLDEADPVYRRWLRPRLASGKLLAWIVEERGVAVASGALWLMRIHPRPMHPSGVTPYLLSMYTDPAHRGRGHARRIVRAAMAWTKANGYPRMTLHASEAGRPLYESLGWTRTWEMALKTKPARHRARGRAPRGAPRR